MVDYKTGIPPTAGDIQAGISSQMPLEALILEKGENNMAFFSVPRVQQAEYWKLKGESALNAIQAIGEGRGMDLRALMENAAQGVQALVAWFDQAETPYLACPDPARRPRYHDYEHLERLAEWAA